MSYQLYPSDLADREWKYIKPLIPAAKPGGQYRKTDMRLAINAIFYITRTGCQWRYLPREYPLGSRLWLLPHLADHRSPGENSRLLARLGARAGRA
jgi:putative transposase